MLRIVDISGNDTAAVKGTIDWATEQKRGLSGAVIKLTEGTGYNFDQAATHWNALGKLNMLRGLYDYLRPAWVAPEDEAAYFLRQLDNRGIVLQPGDMIFGDHEEPGHYGAASPSEWFMRWAAHIENSVGFAPALPGIYSYQYFAGQYLMNPLLGHYGLWYAAYPNGATIETIEQLAPKLPTGFPWTEYMLWQWTDKSTAWPTIGSCDESVSFLTLEQFKAKYGKPAPVTYRHLEVTTATHLRPQPAIEARPFGPLLPVGTRVVEVTPPNGQAVERNGFGYVRTSGDRRGHIYLMDCHDYTP